MNIWPFPGLTQVSGAASISSPCRKEVVDFLMFKLKSGKDPDRESQVKEIKTW